MRSAPADDLEAMSVDELKAAFVGSDAVAEQAIARRTMIAAALDRRTGGLVPETPAGSASPVFLPTAAWVRSQTTLGPGGSGALVRTARLLDAAPVAAAAVRDGALRTEQAAIVAQALTRLDDPELAAAAEPVWVDYATESEPEPLRKRIQHWIADYTPEVFEREQAEAFDRRGLRATIEPDGMLFVRGRVEPASAPTVLTALESIAKQDTEKGDDRRYPQRMSDALVDICHRALRHDGDLPLFGGQPPQVLVTATAEDLSGERGCTSPAVGPLPRWSLEMFACDAHIGRVVMSAEGVVLDVGRLTRFVSPGQRRALVVRDRGCIRKGCGRPPAWCDAHHLLAWEDGGPTDLDNLVLLCRRHHVMWHQGLIGLSDLDLPWLWSLAESGRPPPVLQPT